MTGTRMLAGVKRWLRPLTQPGRPRGTCRPFLETLEQRLAPIVNFSISNPAPIPEGDFGTASVVFTVSRSGDLASAVQVDYATQDGTAVAGIDYQAANGTLRFGSNQTARTIAVAVIGNRIFQSNRTFTLALANPMPSADFASRQAFTTGFRPFNVAVGDFNGDGKPDVVTANAGSNNVSVLLNTTPAGAATPNFATQRTFMASEPRAVAIADFNGDGRPDLAVANANPYTVSVLRNTTPTGAAIPNFAAAQTFATGGLGPYSVAQGDFNGDGKPDLAVATPGSRQAVVLLNTTPTGAATFSFAPARQFHCEGITTVTVADVNGDGKPDLATANWVSGSVCVLLNRTAAGAGIPDFAPAQEFETGSGPLAVATGDLNGDGRPDLATADAGGYSASVLLNTTPAGATTASFAPSRSFGVGTDPASVALGDVNGDGKSDLAVANGHGASTTVSVLLNTTAPGATTPRFAPQQAFASNYGPRAVALADFNTDGKPDLALANQFANTVTVLLNARVPLTGAASFTPPQSFEAGNATYDVDTGDFNGDGRFDLVVANQALNIVSVLLNRTVPGAATPSFAPRQTFATGREPLSVAVGDLNGDGKPDLATANSYSHTVSVLLNTTPAGEAVPSFAPHREFATGDTPTSVTLADLNGDGLLDLVLANYGDNTVSVLFNTTPAGAASPRFAAHLRFATDDAPYSVTAGDVNGDGKPDLAVSCGQQAGTVAVLLNTTPAGAGTPSFAVRRSFATGDYPTAVILADLNGDGRPDLATANYNSDTASVLLNTTAPGDSIPSFAPHRTFATGDMPSSVATGDFNGDSKPDLVLTNFGFDTASVTVSVLLNTTAPGAGIPTFAAQQTFVAGANPDWVAAEDFNGDGKPDLAVSTSPDTVSVLLNNVALLTLSGSPATVIIVDDDAPASISVAAGNNQSARVGSAFATNLAVDVRNNAGNLVEGVSVTFTPPTKGAGGAFAGSNTVLSDASGRAVAPVFTANVIAGAYTVAAVAGSVNTAFSLTNTPGPVAYYYIYPGSELSTQVTQGVPFDIYILPFDEYFNWITDYAGTVEFYTLDPLGTVPSAYTFTGTEGGIGVPGQVTLGSLGMQELYCWDAATVTVFGYALYDVLAPGGSPGPGRLPPGVGDVVSLLDRATRTRCLPA